MKATLSYKSKRNIIIASVIVVLLAAISTAGYFYIKGNDETARAFTQNEITNELTPGEQTQNNGGQQENQTQNPEQPTTPGDQNNNGGEQTPNSQTNNGQNQNNNTTNNGSTPNQTTGDVPNQEYVRERTEERTTITKEYSVEWTPESITANASVQNLNIIRPIISANKSADKNAVVPGETITYTITVTNTGNADGKAIVKDTIPEATEFIENSIKINGEDTNYTAQNLEEGITVDVAKQNEQGEAGTVEVEFKVKVSNIFAQYEKASIINQATVNEEETNEVKNPVIKFEKSANKEKVKVGDTVTYTISIENIGDAEGTVIVKDTIPTGTKLVENSTIKLNGEDTEYTEQKLNDGIELTVKSGERLELTFEVEVLSEITEAVINTAYVNDIPTETIPTQVESLIKFESNGGTSVGSMNGYTGDVIENREMPTTTREGYTFDGWYAEPELTNKVETLPEKYPAGTTTYYAKWIVNNYQYKVQYWYENEQGTYELLDTVLGEKVPYGTVINTFEPKDGNENYVLDHVDPAKSTEENKTANLVITHDESENILNVYYKRNSFDYQIKYYKETANGEELIPSTENKQQQKLKTKITDAILEDAFGANWKNANKPQEGYQDGIVENAEAADYYITIKGSNNIIKVVYKLKTIKYTVKYYFNEKEDASKEYPGTAKYGQQIESVKDYSDGGWGKLSKSTSLPYTIKESENVIRVYYGKPEITVKKTTSVSGVVEPGQNITYTITATNTGYLAGNVTIEDSEPAGTSAANNAKATIKDSTGTKTVELTKLKEGITLNVPAKNGNVNGTATVQFTVKVTGEKLKDKTSNVISNTARVNEKDTTNTVNNTVEKTMKIKENTETIKATNIILVIDSSGSMDEKMDNDDGIFISRCEDANCKKTHRKGWSLFLGNYKYHTKMTTAIDAACRFIDQIYPNQSTNNGTTISVVDFNTNASIVGTMATSYIGAQNLKTAIKNLEAEGNTSMGTALNLANTTLTNIPEKYKDNNNVVIFLSDGAPTDGTAYQAAATTLKTGANKATIYTIGFEIDRTGAQVLRAIATGEKYAFLTDMDKLFETFDDISSSIKESTITKQSEAGKLTLTNVDTTKPIKINGVKVELTDKKLNKINDTTYEIVLSEFSVSELEKEISVEYFSK